MGVAQSARISTVIGGVVGGVLFGAIAELVAKIRSDHASGNVGANAVVEELERRAREAEEQKRRAQREKRHAEELQMLAEERRREADARRERAEEQQRRAEQERQRAEEDRRRAEEEKARVEEAHRQLQVEAARAKEEQRKADEVTKGVEEEKRAEEERRSDEEKRQMEEYMRQAEEEKTKAEETKRRAAEEVHMAMLELEQARHAKAEADQRAGQVQAALEDAERRLKDGHNPVMIPASKEIEATKKRLQYTEGFFHFAVAGTSGAGKSSFINAIRGIHNSSDGAAMTGVVETTTSIQRYPDQNPENPFVWYDVPGAGTLQIPDWTYFNQQGLYVFDCIIILFDSRFTETDIAILRNCHRFDIPAYIVRSKSDQHIRNIMDDRGYESDDEEKKWNKRTFRNEAVGKYTAQTEATVADNLEKAGLEQQRVYLVSKGVLVKVVASKRVEETLDEMELIRDLLTEAHRRRSQTPETLYSEDSDFELL